MIDKITVSYRNGTVRTFEDTKILGRSFVYKGKHPVSIETSWEVTPEEANYLELAKVPQSRRTDD